MFSLINYSFPRLSDFDAFWTDPLLNWQFDTKIPDADIEENEDGFCLKMNLPGLEKKDVKITVEDRILKIESEKKESEKKNKLVRAERKSYEKFSRSFTLYDDIDVENLEAKMTNGVLEVVLPKTKEKKAKLKQVEIN